MHTLVPLAFIHIKGTGLDMFEYAVAIFVQAISNVKPILGTIPLRKSGSVYRVPGALSLKRRQAMALRWIIQAARKRKGKPMDECLYLEIMDASNNTVGKLFILPCFSRVVLRVIGCKDVYFFGVTN